MNNKSKNEDKRNMASTYKPKLAVFAGNAIELITVVCALTTWTTFIYQIIKAFKFSEGYFPVFIFNASLTIILSFIPFLSFANLFFAIFLWRRRGPNKFSYFAFLTFSSTFLLPLITLIMMYFSITTGRVY